MGPCFHKCYIFLSTHHVLFFPSLVDFICNTSGWRYLSREPQGSIQITDGDSECPKEPATELHYKMNFILSYATVKTDTHLATISGAVKLIQNLLSPTICILTKASVSDMTQLGSRFFSYTTDSFFFSQ